MLFLSSKRSQTEVQNTFEQPLVLLSCRYLLHTGAARLWLVALCVAMGRQRSLISSHSVWVQRNGAQIGADL